MSGPLDTQPGTGLLSPSILETMGRVYGHLYDDEAELLVSMVLTALTRPGAPGTIVDWSAGQPKVLGVEDFSRIMESGGLFARKFDMTHDAAILDLVDAHLGFAPAPAPVAEPTTAEDTTGRTSVSNPYDEQWYAKYQSGALRSARAMVPVVIGLFQPTSIVDLGCGTGEWLAACRENGVEDVLGIDGDWVPRAQLKIPPDRFAVHDVCQPLDLDRTFDLAISLETAEHLPPGCAAIYVAALADLAPIVLFSAAVPQQGGRNHVNEQWPSYWTELFHGHGYVPIDCVRPLIWTMPDVEWWYAQNTIVFAHASHVEADDGLRAQFERHGGPPLPLVHPARYGGEGGIDTWADELWRVRDAWKTQGRAGR